MLNANEEIEHRSSDTPGRNVRFEQRTLPDILRIQSALGDKPLIRAAGQTMTYADAPRIAARVAARLSAAGVRPGDRVVVFLTNRIEFLEIWFGLAWLGATLVPINTAFRREQLRHAIATARPRLVITEKALCQQLEEAADVLNDGQCVVALDLKPDDQGTTDTDIPMLADRLVFGVFEQDADAMNAAPVEASDITAILYTSGTTGPAKGVLCPHAQFYWWAINTAEALNITSADVLFTTLPFFHTNALNTLWQAMVYGASFSFTQRFSASAFWQEAENCQATVSYLLGSMAQILLKSAQGKEMPGHQIRIALCPATSANTVRTFANTFSVELVDGYGSTETNLVFSNVVGGKAPASMGRVVDGFEVKIVDENDLAVKPGMPGELLIRHVEPFSMAAGYFENPEATLKAWRNLWFHTGDRVRQDPATGVYYFVDRLVDAIRRRGENISSWEVENALASHPDIAEAAVYGVPSDLESEEDVMTQLVVRPHCQLGPREFIDYLALHIAKFSIPRYWLIVDELPLTENGKIKKKALRRIGVTPDTWDAEAQQP